MTITRNPREAALEAKCADCGRPYGHEHGFPDLVVPHGVWAKISPTGDEGGLLCPSCMCKRAADAGLENVPAVFRSGPFADALPAADGGWRLAKAWDRRLRAGREFGPLGRRVTVEFCTIEDRNEFYAALDAIPSPPVPQSAEDEE